MTVQYSDLLPEMVFVGGKKRSGKDFLCDILVQDLGYHKVHIVEPWLRQWSVAHGYAADDWETVKFKEREAIQRDASASRAKNPNVLIDWFREAIPSLPRPFCVTAVRFINEMELGMQVGALCVRVKTDDETRLARFAAAGDTSPLDDPFEREVDLMPVHLEVAGTLPRESYLPVLGQYVTLAYTIQARAKAAIQMQGVQA